MNLEVRQTNIADLTRQLDALTVGLQRRVLGAGLRTMAEHIAAEMRATSAFQDHTGTLRSRILTRARSQRVRTADGRYVKLPGAAASVVASAPHSYLLEYGTTRMRARPFITPALEGGAAEGFRRGIASMRAAFRAVALELTSGGKVSAQTRRAARL